MASMVTAAATSINTVVVHKGAHLDELFAVALLLMFGKEMFPGVLSANLAFWDRLPEGKTAQQLEQEGFLLIGFGDGRFDEHPNGINGRKKGECAASLVAKALGVERDPALQPLLRFVTTRDLHLGGSPYELPMVIKSMNDVGKSPLLILRLTFRVIVAVHDKSPEYFSGVSDCAGKQWAKVVDDWMTCRFGKANQNAKATVQKLLSFTDKRREKICGNVLELHALYEAVHAYACDEAVATEWAFEILDVLHKKEMLFKEAQRDVSKASVSYHQTKRGKIIIVTGVSDSPFFSAAARSKEGLSAGIVIQQSSKGNVQIYTDQKLALNLDDVASTIRIKELICKKQRPPEDRALLTAEGTLADWYYFPNGRMLLNGSLTHFAPPTGLPLETIERMVHLGLTQ